jgi:hypothetical protein
MHQDAGLHPAAVEITPLATPNGALFMRAPRHRTLHHRNVVTTLAVNHGAGVPRLVSDTATADGYGDQSRYCQHLPNLHVSRKRSTQRLE